MKTPGPIKGKYITLEQGKTLYSDEEIKQKCFDTQNMCKGVNNGGKREEGDHPDLASLNINECVERLTEENDKSKKFNAGGFEEKLDETPQYIPFAQCSRNVQVAFENDVGRIDDQMTQQGICILDTEKLQKILSETNEKFEKFKADMKKCAALRPSFSCHKVTSSDNFCGVPAGKTLCSSDGKQLERLNKKAFYDFQEERQSTRDALTTREVGPLTSEEIDMISPRYTKKEFCEQAILGCSLGEQDNCSILKEQRDEFNKKKHETKLCYDSCMILNKDVSVQNARSICDEMVKMSWAAPEGSNDCKMSMF